jgi:predicted PurR-regulated permease PerM
MALRPEPHPVTRMEATVSNRTILRVLALVTAFLFVLELLWSLRDVITWVVVAAFFAIALNPCVLYLESRGVGHRTAVLIVFTVTVLLVVGFLAAILAPLYEQVRSFVSDVPGNIDRLARWGPLRGHPQLVARLHRAAQDLPSQLPSSAGPLLGIASKIVTAVVNIVTVMFLTLFLLLEMPQITAFLLSLLAPATAEQLTTMQRDINNAVTRYVAGNLFVSVICAAVTGISLYLLGVPFALVLALLAGFFDIIPLVGATIGGVIVSLVAFAHSTTAGIAMVVIYIVYQQIENHVIQPVVMNKSVQVSPFVTLVAVLAGSVLLGMVGALLAIPAAASIQIALREVIAQRARRMAAVRELLEAEEDPRPADATHDYTVAT